MNKQLVIVGARCDVLLYPGSDFIIGIGKAEIRKKMQAW